MKSLIAQALRQRPGAQEKLMKAATFPRFVEWKEKHPKPFDVAGTKRDLRNNFFTELVKRENLSEEAIRYFEFGVHKGASIAWWAENNTNPDSRFYGFDSFVGLPEDWIKGREKGFFSTDSKTPDIDDSRVSFVAGWFHENVHRYLSEVACDQRVVIHFDADLYRSTIFPLMVLGPLLKGGDILMFDEFLDSIHEFRAFEDAVNVFSWQYDFLGATPDYAQVAVRLAAETTPAVSLD
ncbi:MAG: hypothetical protein AB3N11_13275 [Arenibacterium sp.]